MSGKQDKAKKSSTIDTEHDSSSIMSSSDATERTRQAGSPEGCGSQSKRKGS